MKHESFLNYIHIARNIDCMNSQELSEELEVVVYLITILEYSGLDQ